MINAEGKALVDEGIEFYKYTYAKYGAEVLKRGQFAFRCSRQDQPLLRPIWRQKRERMVAIRGRSWRRRWRADAQIPETVRVQRGGDEDIPSTLDKDGKGTVGRAAEIEWVRTSSRPAYEPAVTCGILPSEGRTSRRAAR